VLCTERAACAGAVDCQRTLLCEADCDDPACLGLCLPGAAGDAERVASRQVMVRRGTVAFVRLFPDPC